MPRLIIDQYHPYDVKLHHLIRHLSSIGVKSGEYGDLKKHTHIRVPPQENYSARKGKKAPKYWLKPILPELRRVCTSGKSICEDEKQFKRFDIFEAKPLLSLLRYKSGLQLDNSVKFDFKSSMSAEVSLCDDDDVVKECAAMFNVSEKELTVEHFWVMSELINAVRSDIIGQLYNVKFGSNAMNETQKKSVWEMSKEDQGKVSSEHILDVNNELF
ncbi:hypothetical protein AC249_AIPGENE16318 [Exaiptasia diaphana]|nr:hypothetical protein AC249_AIPGENE16318 [Exaiptasia diaphana]